MRQPPKYRIQREGKFVMLTLDEKRYYCPACERVAPEILKQVVWRKAEVLTCYECGRRLVCRNRKVPIRPEPVELGAERRITRSRSGKEYTGTRHSPKVEVVEAEGWSKPNN